MFDHGRFNRKRYNLPEKSTDIAIRDKYAGELETSPNIGENIGCRSAMETETLAEATLGGGCFAGFTGAETLHARTLSEQVYRLTAAAVTNAEGDIYLTVKCAIAGTVYGALGGLSAMDQNVNLLDEFAGEITGSGTQGADYIFPEINSGEVVNAVAGTAQYDTYYTEIDIDMPNGSVLIIDSDGYTVTLNGENAVYALSGEWPKLDRNVEEIKITNAINGLTYNVAFQERYL